MAASPFLFLSVFSSSSEPLPTVAQVVVVFSGLVSRHQLQLTPSCCRPPKLCVGCEAHAVSRSTSHMLSVFLVRAPLATVGLQSAPPRRSLCTWWNLWFCGILVSVMLSLVILWISIVVGVDCCYLLCLDFRFKF